MLTPITDLRKVYELSNLKKAWARLNSSTQLDYKNHFRHLYNSYGLAIDENLKDLKSRLSKGNYETSHATKLYIPKKSGLLRTLTLLSVEDQLVYQAFANIIASKFLSKSICHYNKNTFSYQYSGNKSPFFYKKWQDGYNAYKKEIKKSYVKGLVYTASFDFTAFYDTIDHQVLCHILMYIGFTNEFCDALVKHLRVWTCTDIVDGKYHGHGIPQGPLSSGIFGEVMMSYIDDDFCKKPSSTRYLRYVDDIKLMSLDEQGVRESIMKLDILSKKLGLFPQSGKLSIHKIEDISLEIKDISTIAIASEAIASKHDLYKKILNLLKKGQITNETQFKYFLYRTKSDIRLENKCISLLSTHPHLCDTIISYLSQRRELSAKISEALLKFIKEHRIYEEMTSKILFLVFSKVSKGCKSSFVDYCVNSLTCLDKSISPNLKAQIYAWLLREGLVKFIDLKRIINEEPSWVIHNIISQIDVAQYGKPSYEAIINELLSNINTDVSVYAAYLAIKEDVRVSTSIAINHVAQYPLRTVGKIKAAKLRESTIGESLSKVFSVKFEDCNWKRFIAGNHNKSEQQIFVCRTYARTDATALVNQLDVFNDIFLDAIYRIEPSLGMYKMGNIGGNLNSATCRLAKKYPAIYGMCTKIHSLRKESDLSHPINSTTKKPTRRITFNEIKKQKQILINGYIEVISFINANVKLRKTAKIIPITSYAP